jgi:methylated-DNA-protein-cysteine methyltransferase-like protein
MKYASIYAAVKRIPRGRVATYGQVARLAGIPRRARLVGYALSVLEDTRVPWHRVVNAQGRISARVLSFAEDEQRVRLEREGVRFRKDRVSLAKYGWRMPHERRSHR